MLSRFLYLALLLSIAGCMSKDRLQKHETLPYDQPPSWSRDAVWYQIFVERFRNGNPEVNPTLRTCEKALTDEVPAEWTLTPWGHNWYEQEAWAKKTGLDFYRTIQMRRYGGDLAGVEQKIPYLRDLGINAVYFNPINDSPSLHKYDARSYHHVDVTFGDDIEGDMALMASENPADPATWKWTSADKKFLALVKKLHEAGIRVILDYSWNHTGNNFWAFKDLQKNLDMSPYKDWYNNVRFVQDASTGETRFEYDGWVGVRTMPELRKVDTQGKIPGHPYEGNLEPAVKQHIYAVCRRWMDPDNNGNFSDGIDGMRLDVAEHVPVGFWRDFRKFVRSVNPEFYLIGENWWTNWPDTLMDPGPWVKGDIFDAVMHYQWFKVARAYFAQPDDRTTLGQFKRQLDSIFLKYPEYTRQAMMNLASSHDSPRLLTAFANKDKYKYNCKPQENKHFKTNRPEEATLGKVRLFLLHQFTFVGSPHIWNGDEMGMTGADDPDNRKPMVWPDVTFSPETNSGFSAYTYSEVPAFDHKMFEYYKSLIALRKSSPAFSNGHYEFLDTPASDRILAYRRTHGHTDYVVVFNNNPEMNEFQPEKGYTEPVFICGEKPVFSNKGYLLHPYSGMVLKIVRNP